ncbi:DUF5703 domain-containing protein [Sphingomonas sp. ASV193]|uniref:DUF5703 domain-containing protein n=1 Tax=Sphingomonas sp. ASV193 TaxID=3144405 RepID=UPI0032E8B16F
MDRSKRRTVKGMTALGALGGVPLPAAARATAAAPDEAPADWLDAYAPSWTSQSANAGASMPCGAHDIGLNVWAEGGALLFYVQQSGAFDETNSYLKLGRVRLTLDPPPPAGAPFLQTLRLADGETLVRFGAVEIALWVDVEQPVIHLRVDSPEPVRIVATYENWRQRDRDYTPDEMSMHRAYDDGAPVVPRQFADTVGFAAGGVLAHHRNRDADTVFDLMFEQQGLAAHKAGCFNPLANLTFGLLMGGPRLVPEGQTSGRYASTDFTGWSLASRARARRHALSIACRTEQDASLDDWRAGIARLHRTAAPPDRSRTRSRAWWRAFWNRSHIVVQPGPPRPDSLPWRIGRNYQLFRHQLGTNARGRWPTKFNGGNFTTDPEYIDPAKRMTPDFRAWGGGEFTAQNQRLVHWPMLKSGDSDLMTPQLDFYRRIQATAELRTRTYWGHRGACFVEQIENFGLACGREWGWHRAWDHAVANLPGIQDNPFVDYLWDTVLEFCLMMLETVRFTGAERPGDLGFIDSCLTFFDEHYRREQRRIAGRELDPDGHLVFYPGTACETYKNAVNSTVTIAGLDAVLCALLALPDRMVGPALRQRFAAMRASLPPIALRELNGHRVIAPANLWDRIQNVEIPQLYPVFPYGQYGVGRPDLQLARDTWHHGVDTEAQRGIVSWHQDPIFCARLGLTDEAATLVGRKLDDAPRRYPTFWGPGHDWAPDHNWGGSGMIALQEMLMQTPGEAIHLFPAWPRDWDVDFRLHAPGRTVVEARLADGRLTRLSVEPPAQASRIVLPDWLAGQASPA